MITLILRWIAIAFASYIGTKVATTQIEKFGVYDFAWVDSDGDGDGKNDETYLDNAMDAGRGIAMAGIVIVGVLIYASRRS